MYFSVWYYPLFSASFTLAFYPQMPSLEDSRAKNHPSFRAPLTFRQVKTTVN